MNKLTSFWTVFLTIICVALHAQQISTPSYFSNSEKKEGSVNLSTGSTITLSVIDKSRTSGSSAMRERSSSAKLYLRLDVGEDYVKINGNFSIKMQLETRSNGNLIPGVGQVSVSIDQKNPEALKIIDLTSKLAGLSGNLSVHVADITDANGNVLNLPSNLFGNHIKNNLRLSVTLVRTYDVDVRTMPSAVPEMSTPVSVLPVTFLNKIATFHWQPTQGDGYPNYELQILKLENTSRDLQYSNDEIETLPDWSKALKIETQSYKTDFAITVAEGTGFYIWRVRPIGTYFEGGIANSENYGVWSYAGTNNAPVKFNKNSINQSNGSTPNTQTPYAFYFFDKDEKINWIYSRAFTEADPSSAESRTKVSEQMSYADGLLGVKQSQAFNSSNNTTLVTQTIPDFSGRPGVVTLPVPVDGGLTGYKVDFVKNSNGDLYTATDFDLPSNTRSPGKINDAANTPFSYYSNHTNNLPGGNENVPDAQGYPYTRTLLKTDGSGRVTEESGVGEVHALGTQRTKRILYGTPSDEELIRIFGDEAPLSESVIKTTTIDPNNTVSVVYTSKEGKTIATALISTSTSNLESLQNQGDPAIEDLTIFHSLNQNVVSGDKFVSSKRIVVPDLLDITLDYKTTDLPTSTNCAGGNCSYKLRFFLINITTGVTYQSDKDGSGDFLPFDVSNSFSFPSGWKFRAKDGVSDPISHASNDPNKIPLPAGEYVIIKEAYSAKDANAIAELNRANNAKYQPIFDVIAEKMKNIKNSQEYDAFLTFMTGLKTKLDTYQTSKTDANETAVLTHLGLTKGSAPTDDLPADYKLPDGFSLEPIPTTNVATPTLTFNTSCCGQKSAQLPKPEICYMCNGKPGASTSNTLSEMNAENAAALNNGGEAIYGFDNIMAAAGSEADTKTAIYTLLDHYFISPLTNKLAEIGTDLYKVAPGFSTNGIKFMLYNMLISKYETSSIIFNATTNRWERSKLNETTRQWETTNVPAGPPTNYNYKCKENILECWEKALALLNSFEVQDDINVIQTYNEQDGDNAAQNEADDEENYEELSKRQKKKLSHAVSKDLEDFNDSDDGKVPKAKIQALTNLMNNFMDCAGYQFAAIINGEDLPPFVTDANADHIPDEYLSSNENDWLSTLSTSNQSLMSANVSLHINSGSTGTSLPAPVLFKIDNNNNAVEYIYNCGTGNDATPEKILYYPYMIKPEWMFKYFVYNNFRGNASSDFIDDKSVQLPNQVLIDMQSCYEDLPTAYLNTAPPSGMVTCQSCAGGHFHKEWSSSEILTFYKRVSGAPACWKTKGVDVPYFTEKPECEEKDELIARAKKELDAVKDACNDKRAEMKKAFMDELEASCYIVVKCKDASMGNQYLSEKEVDLMIDKAIEKCIEQVEGIRGKLPGLSCSSPGTAPYGCNVATEFPKCVINDCYMIILTKENTLKPETSGKAEGALFADCDAAVLDMLLNGSFLPHIEPYGGTACTTAKTKEWRNSSCTPDPLCNEVRTCPGNTEFKTYSKITPVSHTSTP